MNSLVRPRGDRVIAGVCAGIARRFDMKPSTVRILSVILVLFAGLSLWAYILLWILMPNE
ncbi:PspC domain-containing protein [Microbacterium sp. LTA6]|uniref:PspC domain-containing protein n=1 Tax=unclassified Microbacterium TaxID=2609290 RepID=UPI0031392BFC